MSRSVSNRSIVWPKSKKPDNIFHFRFAGIQCELAWKWLHLEYLSIFKFLVEEPLRRNPRSFCYSKWYPFPVSSIVISWSDFVEPHPCGVILLFCCFADTFWLDVVAQLSLMFLGASDCWAFPENAQCLEFWIVLLDQPTAIPTSPKRCVSCQSFLWAFNQQTSDGVNIDQWSEMSDLVFRQFLSSVKRGISWSQTEFTGIDSYFSLYKILKIDLQALWLYFQPNLIPLCLQISETTGVKLTTRMLTRQEKMPVHK